MECVEGEKNRGGEQEGVREVEGKAACEGEER